MRDRYGVEWSLVCVLPDIPIDIQHARKNEIEECLHIHPSLKTGNGIFIANFQLKKMAKEVHRQEDPETIAKRIAEMSITEMQDLEAPLKRRRRSKGRKKGEKLKIRLPKVMRLSVERLSIPKPILLQMKAINQQRHPSSSKIDMQRDSSVTNDEKHSDYDISIYGSVMKTFYGPKEDALKQIAALKEQMKSVRWQYPARVRPVWK